MFLFVNEEIVVVAKSTNLIFFQWKFFYLLLKNHLKNDTGPLNFVCLVKEMASTKAFVKGLLALEMKIVGGATC